MIRCWIFDNIFNHMTLLADLYQRKSTSRMCNVAEIWSSAWYIFNCCSKFFELDVVDLWTHLIMFFTIREHSIMSMTFYISSFTKDLNQNGLVCDGFAKHFAIIKIFPCHFRWLLHFMFIHKHFFWCIYTFTTHLKPLSSSKRLHS